jgi:hypothetical protein
MSEDKCSLGSRPKRPTKPKRPSEKLWKTHVVWTSDDESISLSELLNMLPPDSRAEDTKIDVINSCCGKKVVISCDTSMQNPKFLEQLLDYETKIIEYEREIIKWQLADAEWCKNIIECEEILDDAKQQVVSMFREHDKKCNGTD